MKRGVQKRVRSKSAVSNRLPTNKELKRLLMRSKETQIFARSLEEQSLSSAVTCVVQELSRVSQGDTRENRSGDRIVGTGLNWKLALYNSAAVPVGVRVIVIDTIADKYAAVADDFTNNSSSDGPFVAEALADLTQPLTRGFKVLYDNVILLAGLGDASMNEYGMLKWSHRFSHPRNFHVGDLATSDQSVSHNLRMILLARSLDNDATASVVEYTLGTEYMFKDE